MVMKISMPRVVSPGECVPCMSAELKRALREATQDPQVLSLADSMDTCIDGQVLQLCTRQARGRRPKRAASAYQEFIGSCMRNKDLKGKPFGTASKYMKECSAEWRKRKSK